MFELIRSDIEAKARLRTGMPRWVDYLVAALERGTVAVIVYRFGRWARSIRIPGIRHFAMLLYYMGFYLVQMFTGISIQAHTSAGCRFVVRNFACIFVLAERIGDGFTVCEGVTVGNVRGASRLPIIGSNVYLEPGSKVLGAVTIGDNVVVRANSLVVSDVPSNSVALGNPARVTALTDATLEETASCHKVPSTA